MDLNIEGVVEKLVSLEIKDICLESMVRDFLRETIAGECRTMISKITKEEAAALIHEEIRAILDGPVFTDDGWGKRESHPSFEDLFKKVLKESIGSNYNVKKEIGSQVKSRVDALIKQDFDRVLEKIVDSLTNSKLVKKG